MTLATPTAGLPATPVIYQFPTARPTSTRVPTWTPVPTATPTQSPTPTNTPAPTATPTATATPMPSPTSGPASSFARAPVPPTATPTVTLTPTPSYAYQVAEIYQDTTSNLFLTGYIAIVNGQEIPIGGIKAVGSFEPGGQRYESPLSKWFFDVASARGTLVKTGSVKFEPPGGIQAGVWFIHLEDEWGTRLSEDVPVSTDPASPQWFFIKFKQPGPAGTALAKASNAQAASAYPRGPVATAARGSTPPRAVTPSPTASSSGWSFAGVQIIENQEQQMVTIYADAVNETGASQQILYTTGEYYDGAGQVIPGYHAMQEYRPVTVVPAGGRVPLRLTVHNIQGVADVDLRVFSQPSSETPRQDLEFLDLDTSTQEGSFCVVGKLRNPGDRLSKYLVISATLYNSEDRVINFGSVQVSTPGSVVGDQAVSFNVCVDTLNQEAARYEVQAWGQ